MDGTFTRDEWAFLTSELQQPEPDDCPVAGDGTLLLPRDQCDAAALFGQRLFFDPALSGPIVEADPFLPPGGNADGSGRISCASCHDSSLVDKNDPTKGRRFFIDVRSKPGNISAGARHTRHNAMSVINTAFKSAVARQRCATSDKSFCTNVYSWTGAYADPGGVLNLAGVKAMNSDSVYMTTQLCGNGSYTMTYRTIFGASPARCPISAIDPTHDDPTVYRNLGIALDAYTRRLKSVDSKLDAYVAATVTDDLTTSPSDILTGSERRGLEVFIGKGMCIECHRGFLLSDLQFHNTGLAQSGPFVPAFDGGFGDEALVGKPAAHLGEFLTPPLRNVAKTAPYMHAGQLATLADVIEFYRRGGDEIGFAGTKDPRIQPLEITDEEARDLEAFLGTLSGSSIDEGLATRPAP